MRFFVNYEANEGCHSMQGHDSTLSQWLASDPKSMRRFGCEQQLTNKKVSGHIGTLRTDVSVDYLLCR